MSSLTNAVVAILREKPHKVLDELRPVGCVADQLGEDALPRTTRFREGPTAQDNNDLETRVARFELTNVLVQVRFDAVHVGNLEGMVDVSERNVEVRQSVDGDLVRSHPTARLVRIPGLPVADDPLLNVGRGDIGPGLFTVGLASRLTECLPSAAEATLGAARVESTLLAGMFCILATGRLRTAVRLAALTTILWTITTPAIDATA